MYFWPQVSSPPATAKTGTSTRPSVLTRRSTVLRRISSPAVTPPLASSPADAVAPDTGGVHPDVVPRYVLDPWLKPGVDDRRALGFRIQMMRRPSCQHEPPLARFHIRLVGLDRDLVL